MSGSKGKRMCRGLTWDKCVDHECRTPDVIKTNKANSNNGGIRRCSKDDGGSLDRRVLWSWGLNLCHIDDEREIPYKLGQSVGSR